MTPSMLSEMLLPLVAALVLLTAIKAATRRPTTPRKSHTTSRHAMRDFAKKGAAVETISQSTRTPHDVISLALYVEQRKLAGHRAAVRS